MNKLFTGNSSYILLIMLLFNCQDDVEKKQSNECNLIKMTQTFSWLESPYVFQYKYVKDHLVKVGSDTVIYDNDKVVSIGQFRKFEYDSKGLLLSKYVYNIWTYRYYYSYNGSAQVITVKVVIDKGPEYSPRHVEYDYNFVYESDSSSNPTSGMNGDKFEFDDKKRPMEKFNPLIFGDNPGENNITKLISGNNGITSTVYEYNEHGYPIKAVANNLNWGTTTTIYEYECH